MSSSSAAFTSAAENRESLTLVTADSARDRLRSAMTIDVINDRRDAIFAIALPTPPAPITSAFMVGLSVLNSHNRFTMTVCVSLD
jgi:hypothetical protein